MLSHVLDCFWLKYGNRVPKLDAPAFKDHRVEAKMRARGDGDQLEENGNPAAKKQQELTKEQKMERMKEILAKMKANKEEKSSKKK